MLCLEGVVVERVAMYYCVAQVGVSTHHPSPTLDTHGYVMFTPLELVVIRPTHPQPPKLQNLHTAPFKLHNNIHHEHQDRLSETLH